jgi:hypothetical protein
VAHNLPTADAHDQKIIAQQAWFVNKNDARKKLSFVRTRIGDHSAHPLITTLHPHEHAPSANLSRQPSTDSCASLDDTELRRCGDQATSITSVKRLTTEAGDDGGSWRPGRPAS